MFEGAKTLLGILIGAAPTIATLLGYEVSPDFTGDAENILAGFLTIGGAALAIYGRIQAKGPMWFTRKK